MPTLTGDRCCEQMRCERTTGLPGRCLALIRRPRCGRYPAYDNAHVMIGTPWVENVFSTLCTKFAPELLEDERFATEGRADQGKLIINMVAMRRELFDAFRSNPAATAEAIAAANVEIGNANSVANRPENVHLDPQVIHNKSLFEVDTGTDRVGRMRMARPAAIFSRTPSKIPRGALPPKYGEHGSELLEEMGYSADEIALLREQGVLK